MRFEHEIPRYGSKRTITKFLLRPVTIYTHHESGGCTVGKRWLETAKWEEIYTKGRIGNFWKKIRWLTN